MRLENQSGYYLINSREYPMAVILNAGDEVTVTYVLGDGELLTGVALERR